MGDFWYTFQSALGLGADSKDMSLLQVCLRALVIYTGGLIILRFGGSRFLGKHTVFDIILGVVLGSVLSRAVNGSAPLLPTLGAAVALVSAHYLLGWTALRTHRIGALIKGSPEVIVRDGQVQWDVMRRKVLSRRDLEEALRLNGSTEDLEQIQEARFERNGDISIIKKPSVPRVVEVQVREGVQTIRIEIG